VLGVLTVLQVDRSAAPGVPRLPLPGDLPTLEEAATLVASDVEVDMAVGILTQPDIGSSDRTLRFSGPIVTYQLDLPDYPDAYLAHVRAAFGYVGDLTGVAVVEVTGPADVVVTPKPGTGARASAYPAPDGSLSRSTVSLGCCVVRAVWEDILQAFGPTGDKADGRSIFTNNLERTYPSRFDAWVLWMLYTQPPGSTPEQLRSALLLHRQWAQGLDGPGATGEIAAVPG